MSAFPLPLRRRDLLALGVVLLAAAGLAALLYLRFLREDRQLWVNSCHDRNAHLLTALELAEAVRHGRLTKAADVINGARVWGPLHPVLAAAVLTVGGFDYRLAVLPSLAGWALTAVFAFLVARRAAPRHRNLAGVIALLLVVGGPAHRGYATDIMLESLGAGLTLAALYAYLVAVQRRTAAAGRWLGLALTLLYLEKYNYWLIVLLSVAVAAVPELLRAHGPALRDWWRRLDWRALLRRELLDPCNWLAAVALAVTAAVRVRGDRPWDLAGHEISLYPPHNVLQIAYLALVARLWRWWRAGGREAADRLEEPWRRLARWHAWPALLWMTLPKHFGYFLWFVSPANGPAGQSGSFLSGLGFYLRPAATEYHASAAVAVLVVGLFAAALARWRRLRPGAAALLACFLIGAALTARHPNHQTRYLHSWMAAGWAAAGVGLAALLPRARAAATRVLAGGLGAAAVAGVAWLTVPGLLSGDPAPTGGPQPGRPSLLELTDFYAGDVRTARKAVILTEVPFRFTARWTALAWRADPDCCDCVECCPDGLVPPWARRRDDLLNWLNGCDCDTVVAVEDGPDAGYWERFDHSRLYEGLGELLRRQSRYHLVKSRTFARQGCIVTVWKRTE